MLVDTILDKKGSNIVILDIRDQAVFASYFLLCNGENERQLRTLVDNIIQEGKQKAEIIPLGTEGDPNSGWLLIDYGDLIVHVFSPEKRHYYKLEDLWVDAHTILHMQ